MNLVALNLRKVNPELRSALKREAKGLGMGLDEYSVAILEARKALPPGMIWRAQTASVTASVISIRQEEPPNVGNWDKQDQQPAITIAPGSQASAAAIIRKACPHGWMNRAICPDCRAKA